MRPFRAVRLLVIPAVVVPVVLSTVVVSGAAWAKGDKAVICRSVSGTASSWQLMGCNNPAITGGSSTAVTAFSPTMTAATITWAPGAKRGGPPDTSTISMSVFATTKNKCSVGSVEYEMLGKVAGNSFSPALKVNHKVKIFVCESISGSLTNTIKGRLRTAKL